MDDDWDLPDELPESDQLPVSPHLKVGKMTMDELIRANSSHEGFLEVVKQKAVVDGLDWNRIAHDAASMYLTGKYTQKQIADQIGVSLNQLAAHVDLKGVRMQAEAALAARAYERALEDDKMNQFVLSRQMGWNAKTDVQHSGQINLKPVLNIGVKQITANDVPLATYKGDIEDGEYAEITGDD
jgi:hypothetical protein